MEAEKKLARWVLNMKGVEPILTVEGLIKLPHGRFAGGVGEIPSQEAEYIVGQPYTLKVVKWVATKGYGYDWAVYFLNGSLDTEEEIYQNGFKLEDEEYIRKFVPCDDDAFKKYRY